MIKRGEGGKQLKKKPLPGFMSTVNAVFLWFVLFACHSAGVLQNKQGLVQWLSHRTLLRVVLSLLWGQHRDRACDGTVLVLFPVSQ